MTPLVWIARRLAATIATALVLITLALLWQLHPAWPPLPASLAAAFAWPAIHADLELVLWLVLIRLTLALLAGSLRLLPEAGIGEDLRVRRLFAARPRLRRPPARRWRSPLDPPPAPRRGLGRQAAAPHRYVPSWAQPRFTLTRPDQAEPAREPPPQPAAAPPPSRADAAAEDEQPRILLLGPLDLPGDERRGRRTKAQTLELIAYLVLHPAGATSDELLEALWPNQDPRRSERRLWVVASEARQRLEGAISRDRDRYRLDRARVWVDLDQLEALLAQAESAADERTRHATLEQALRLFRGEPLQGSDYPWAEGARRRLRAGYLDLLERTGRARLQSGDRRGTLEAAEAGIAADELNEAFWRLALEAEAALGLRDAVIHRYQTLEQLLDERLGLNPEPATRTLYRRLLAQAA